MLRLPRIGTHGRVVLHGRRRSVVSGRGIGHVSRSRHVTVLIMRLHVVMSSPIRIHVVRGVHGLLIDVLVIVVAAVLLRPTSTSRTMSVMTMTMAMSSGGRSSAGAGSRSHLHATLCLLPSRQMATVVHHAGLGFIELR